MGVQMFQIPLEAQAASTALAQNLTKLADLSTNTVAVDHYGIVAIVVEDSLLSDSTNYPGYISDYADKLKSQTLSERINRYAVDVQGAQEYAKSLIIRVKKDEKVEQITAALEKLYQDGDGTANEINKLAGVVIVGDVPLPVVNKKGNHFVSLLPYTDFEDKVYIYNAASGEYEANPDLKFPKEEVWSGVIKAPVSEANVGDDGRQLLAKYFDKNHLFHIGVPDFAAFNKKTLFADLFNEFKGMNYASYSNYVRYLAHWEDFIYNRYDKDLAQSFFNEVEAEGI